MNIHLKELIILATVDKALDSFKPQIENFQKEFNQKKKEIDNLISKINILKSEIEENIKTKKNLEENIKSQNRKLKDISYKKNSIRNEKELKALISEETVVKDNLKNFHNGIERVDNINSKKEIELKELQEKLEILKSEFIKIEKEMMENLKNIEIQKSSLYEKREKTILK